MLNKVLDFLVYEAMKEHTKNQAAVDLDKSILVLRETDIGLSEKLGGLINEATLMEREIGYKQGFRDAIKLLSELDSYIN